jgi:site-specific recombinase XerD
VAKGLDLNLKARQLMIHGEGSKQRMVPFGNLCAIGTSVRSYLARGVFVPSQDYPSMPSSYEFDGLRLVFQRMLRAGALDV